MVKIIKLATSHKYLGSKLAEFINGHTALNSKGVSAII